jgi:hypothetical protein
VGTGPVRRDTATVRGLRRRPSWMGIDGERRLRRRSRSQCGCAEAPGRARVPGGIGVNGSLVFAENTKLPLRRVRRRCPSATVARNHPRSALLAPRARVAPPSTAEHRRSGLVNERSVSALHEPPRAVASGIRHPAQARRTLGPWRLGHEAPRVVWVRLAAALTFIPERTQRACRSTARRGADCTPRQDRGGFPTVGHSSGAEPDIGTLNLRNCAAVRNFEFRCAAARLTASGRRG